VWATPGAAAALLGRATRAPVLLHLTGGDLVSLPEYRFGQRSTPRGRLQLRVALAGASHVTTPSRVMVDAAGGVGIRAERLPLGVAVDRWPPVPPRPRDPAAPARLLHVASLNPVKDQPTLLQALRLLVERGVDFRADIVGEDTLRGRIQAMASALALDARVRFHGFLPHDALRPLVEAADLHVVSSRHEADPTSLLECAVAGIPTAGTAVGHLVEWAPTAGVSVPVGRADLLADGIAAMLADEGRRLEVARAAQARALAEDADWSADRVLGIYRRLVAGRSENPITR